MHDSQQNSPAMIRTRRWRGGRGSAIGITALPALIVAGVAGVAMSAPTGAVSADATAGAAHVFWTEGVPGTIGRANVDGTAADQNFVTGGSQPHRLAVDATHVYW